MRIGAFMASLAATPNRSPGRTPDNSRRLCGLSDWISIGAKRAPWCAEGPIAEAIARGAIGRKPAPGLSLRALDLCEISSYFAFTVWGRSLDSSNCAEVHAMIYSPSGAASPTTSVSWKDLAITDRQAATVERG